MFTIPEAINLFLRQMNAQKRKFLIGIFLIFKSLDFSLLNNSKILRSLTGLQKTIKIIDVIEETILIIAFADPDFKAAPRLLESI